MYGISNGEITGMFYINYCVLPGFYNHFKRHEDICGFTTDIYNIDQVLENLEQELPGLYNYDNVILSGVTET